MLCTFALHAEHYDRFNTTEPLTHFRSSHSTSEIGKEQLLKEKHKREGFADALGAAGADSGQISKKTTGNMGMHVEKSVKPGKMGIAFAKAAR